MKKSALSTLLVLLITFSHAQLSQSLQNDKTAITEKYRFKAKNFNTAGFACLGGGTLFIGVAFATFPKDYDLFWSDKSSDNQAGFASVMAILGAAAVITSIPMFVNGAMYMHRARVSIQNESLSKNLPIKAGNSFTSLSLSISLGKQ